MIAAGLAFFYLEPPMAAGWALALLVALRWAALLAAAGYAARRRSLTGWIFVGMLAGAEVGHDFPAAGVHLEVLATIFIRLIKTIVAPLLFSTLVVGIAGHSDLRKVGRMALKAFVYFEVVSTLALLLGFAAIHISQAGAGVSTATAAAALGTGPGSAPRSAAQSVSAPAPHSTQDLLVNAFPENIAKSVAEGQLLQIVVFSVIFAVALAMVPAERRRPLVALAESLSETMFKFTNIVMLLAPLAVFGATSYTIAHMGFGVLLPLSKLILTLYVALLAFILLVLLPVALWVGIPLRRFLKAVAEPVTIAFATASSEASLPRAIEELESLGVARETVSFVLATGYSFNLDGSSLYISLATMFVVQAAGIHLTLGQQAMVFLTLLISSKGAAGVARASLLIVLGVVSSFHFPLEPVMLIFGIDQIMDMGRTAVSVLGNCVATMAIARWEGETLPFAPGSGTATGAGEAG